MKKELALLNFICIVVAIAFVIVAVVNALTTGAVLTTDNLFITMVCLVIALLFAVNPLLYLKSEGKLPIPFLKSDSPAPQVSAGSATWNAQRLPAANNKPLLDAKGRAVPPDVKAIMSKMGTAESKEA